MEMKSGAQLSSDRKYRYALWRTWQEGDGHVMFIGLNPSTADETEDDPTIRRCMSFAKRLGYGGIYMLNLFAYRATSPKDLMKADGPVGAENDKYLVMYFDILAFNIACWGTHGAFVNRGETVIELLGRENLHCFGLTKNGQPKHTLYLKRNAEIISLSLLDLKND